MLAASLPSGCGNAGRATGRGAAKQRADHGADIASRPADLAGSLCLTDHGADLAELGEAVVEVELRLDHFGSPFQWIGFDVRTMA